MNPTHTIRRLASILAGLAAAALALAAPPHPPPWPDFGTYPAQDRPVFAPTSAIHTIVVGGNARLADHPHRGRSRGPRRRAGTAPRPGMGRRRHALAPTA